MNEDQRDLQDRLDQQGLMVHQDPEVNQEARVSVVSQDHLVRLEVKAK